MGTTYSKVLGHMPSTRGVINVWARYIQYKATLTTSNVTQPPVLEDGAALFA